MRSPGLGLLVPAAFVFWFFWGFFVLFFYYLLKRKKETWEDKLYFCTAAFSRSNKAMGRPADPAAPSCAYPAAGRGAGPGLPLPACGAAGPGGAAGRSGAAGRAGGRTEEGGERCRPAPAAAAMERRAEAPPPPQGLDFTVENVEKVSAGPGAADRARRGDAVTDVGLPPRCGRGGAVRAVPAARGREMMRQKWEREAGLCRASSGAGARVGGGELSEGARRGGAVRTPVRAAPLPLRCSQRDRGR